MQDNRFPQKGFHAADYLYHAYAADKRTNAQTG